MDAFTLNIYWAFFLAVPILETLRIVFHCRDMAALAEQKQVSKRRWVWFTILTWAGVEISVLSLWLFFVQWDLFSVLAGVLVAILTARLLFALLKRQLLHLPDGQWDEKIDQIGSDS